MRGLTVRQPWAWAIVHGGKTIENRRQAWTYRGPIAIHAGRGMQDIDAIGDMRVRRAILATRAKASDIVFGAVVGVANLIDAHPADGCCEPWGEPDGVHLVLGGVRPVDPVPCRGSLGLWRVDADLEARIREAVR